MLAPAPILDEHARRVAEHVNAHGATAAAVLAETLEIPAKTLRQPHMAERLQARHGIRRQRQGRRIVFTAPHDRTSLAEAASC